MGPKKISGDTRKWTRKIVKEKKKWKGMRRNITSVMKKMGGRKCRDMIGSSQRV